MVVLHKHDIESRLEYYKDCLLLLDVFEWN